MPTKIIAGISDALKQNRFLTFNMPGPIFKYYYVAPINSLPAARIWSDCYLPSYYAVFEPERISRAGGTATGNTDCYLW